MVRVELEGVRKVFGGDTVALDGIDATVEDGEFFTLVGPSGCGKTTTLRVIAGLETPTDGTVRFGDADMTGVPTEERDVGIVFQSYALFPHMSVGENVAYGLRFREPPAGRSIEERVTELLDLVDLGGMADRDPDQLSGGQQQRVALARALAPGPQLLLLDEPMSALDARLREQLRRQIRRIQEELGITTVYVTHDQSEALAISDRVAVMHDGRIEQIGTPQEVYHDPATRFVATFLGENNLFEGEVVDSDPDTGVLDVAVDAREEPLRVVADGDHPPGTRVTLAVRPERFSLEPGADQNRFDVRVETTEFLGESTRVYAEWAGGTLVLRIGGTGVPAGETTVGFPPDAARLV